MKQLLTISIILLLAAIVLDIISINKHNNSTTVIIKSPKIDCSKYQDGTISCTIKVDK